LKARYQKEKHVARRTRLQALWLLRRGQRIADVAEVVGVHGRTVQDWIAWYRQGGLSEVLRRVRGYHVQGKAPYLNAVQQKALVARVALGDFRTVWDVRSWVEARWGVGYSYDGMYDLMRRHKLRLKVPRPYAEKRSLEAQSAWKRGA
jgi:transposase